MIFNPYLELLMTKSLFIKIALCICICLLVGYIGSMATGTSVNNWYVGLSKPSWSPPNWVFAPVWISLYILLGVATALVWERGSHHKLVRTALLYLVYLLVLNCLWSIAFFGYQSPYFALLIITALLIVLVFTIRYYRIVHLWAALILIPYLLWVSFAALLNFSIWQLN